MGDSWARLITEPQEPYLLARLLFQGGTEGVLAMPYIDDLLGEEYVTGVYCIRNKVNAKRYVGSGSHVGGTPACSGCRKRLTEHRKALEIGKHHNKFLQRAWDKYGADAFEFRVVETCPPDRCLEREQFWMDHWQSANPEFGYNICSVAGSTLGVTPSDETRAKMRVKKLGRKLSPEAIARIGEVTRERWKDPEYKERLNATKIGRKRTGQALENVRNGHKVLRGKPRSDETKAKLSTALTGRKLTLEHRLKISESHLRRNALKRDSQGGV